MNDQRETAIAQTFVSLASGLTLGGDVQDLLSTLVEDSARLLDVSTAGLLLADGLGVLHVLATTSEDTRQLELHQLQRDEGPCLDCFSTGAPVLVADLAVESARWPDFVPRATAAGFRSVHAVPMRLRDRVLGTLGLFGAETGALSKADVALGQALADVASVALVQHQLADDSALVAEQLQSALTSRVLIEQAKGVLAQQGSVSMEQAFAALRQFGRDRNLTIGDVAGSIVDRTIPAEQVLAHHRQRRARRA